MGESEESIQLTNDVIVFTKRETLQVHVSDLCE